MKKAPDWLGLRARSNPEDLCLSYRNSNYSFGQVDKLVSSICQEIESNRPHTENDLVGILAADPMLTCILVLAAARLSRPVAVLNERLSDKQIQDQCEILNLQRVLVSRLEPEQIKRELGLGRIKTELSLILESAYSQSSCQNQVNWTEGDLNVLQGYVFTSGTTGAQKAIPLTFANHYWSATASAYRLGYAKGDCWLHCMPLCHVGGVALLFRALLFGFSLHLSSGFDIEEVKGAILDRNITMASFVPTMLVRLLDAELRIRPGQSPFRFALIGGAKVSVSLLDKCKEHGIVIVPSFGMTETCSHIAALSPFRGESIKGEGPPLLFAEITIRNSRHEKLGALQRGEIWVRGPQISGGNTNSDGWLRTGDLGYLDRRGNLVVLEREYDVYNIGGETVYSLETIEIIEQFPGILDCWVLGLPDREWGWQLIALVVPRTKYFFTVEDLILHCRKSLSALQCPREIRFVDSIPRSTAGKVLREQAIVLAESLLE